MEKSPSGLLLYAVGVSVFSILSVVFISLVQIVNVDFSDDSSRLRLLNQLLSVEKYPLILM